MKQRYFVHFACAVLMLIAQHGVLTHGVWHLGENLSAHAHVKLGGNSQVPDRSNGSTQSKLCDLHIVMSSLLAGDSTGPSIQHPALLPQAHATFFTVPLFAELRLTPPARAPPVLL